MTLSADKNQQHLEKSVQWLRPEEPFPRLEAAKWLQQHFLLGRGEWQRLFTELNPRLFPSGRVVDAAADWETVEGFLAYYDRYLEEQKSCFEGFTINPLYLTGMLAHGPESIVAKNLEGGYLLAPCEPVVQLQPHFFGYFHEEKAVKSKVFGKHSIRWGVTASYPQVAADVKTGAIHKVYPKGGRNASLYLELQRWLRHHTLPVTFLVNGQSLHSGLRLGKECFGWVNELKQLAQNGLQVQCRGVKKS